MRHTLPLGIPVQVIAILNYSLHVCTLSAYDSPCNLKAILILDLNIISTRQFYILLVLLIQLVDIVIVRFRAPILLIRRQGRILLHLLLSVSYTHLTLPTSDLV